MANSPIISGQSNISRSDPYVPSKEVPPIKKQPESFAPKDTMQTACCCSCFSTIWQGICNFFSSIWNGLFGKSHREPSEQIAPTSPLVTACPQSTASSSSSQTSSAVPSSNSSSTLSTSASSTASAATVKYKWANAIITKYEQEDGDFTYSDLDGETLEAFKFYNPKQKLEFLIELTNVNFKSDRKNVPPEILAAFIQNVNTDTYLSSADWNDLQSKATKVDTYLDLHKALIALLNKRVKYPWAEKTITKHEENDPTYDNVISLTSFKGFSIQTKIAFLIQLTDIEYEPKRKKVSSATLKALIEVINIILSESSVSSTSAHPIDEADVRDLQTKAENPLALHNALKNF